MSLEEIIVWNVIYPRRKDLFVLGSGRVFSRSILEQVAGSLALVRRTDFLIPAISIKIENVEFILLCIYHDSRYLDCLTKLQ